MVLYEVTAVPEAELRQAYEQYMRETHIRDVLETGCFVSAQLAMLSARRYRTTYVAAEQSQLDRYLEVHAQRLREDFAQHFPAGIAVTREVWGVVEEWRAEYR